MTKVNHPDFVACHICSLAIPPSITAVNHPLFGTIDHLIPRSKGGGNGKDNRAPAHWRCNKQHGNHDIRDGLRMDCARVAAAALIQYGAPRKHIARARMMLELSRPLRCR